MVSSEGERCAVPDVLLSDRITEARLQRRLDKLSDQEQGENGDGDRTKTIQEITVCATHERSVRVDGDALVANDQVAEDGLKTASNGSSDYEGDDVAGGADEHAV
jgi:hypothetical protein